MGPLLKNLAGNDVGFPNKTVLTPKYPRGTLDGHWGSSVRGLAKSDRAHLRREADGTAQGRLGNTPGDWTEPPEGDLGMGSSPGESPLRVIVKLIEKEAPGSQLEASVGSPVS